MKASSDPGNKTVRVAASWALANLTDILLHSRDEMELTGDLIKTSEATVVIGTLLFKYKLLLIPKKNHFGLLITNYFISNCSLQAKRTSSRVVWLTGCWRPGSRWPRTLPPRSTQSRTPSGQQEFIFLE